MASDDAALSPHKLRHWPSLAWGLLRRRRDVARMETFRARQVEITSDREQPCELDGDVIEPSRSLTVTVRSRALCLCVPEEPPESGVG